MLSNDFYQHKTALDPTIILSGVLVETPGPISITNGFTSYSSASWLFLWPTLRSSHCHPIVDLTPVDEIYGCPVCKWVVEICHRDRQCITILAPEMATRRLPLSMANWIRFVLIRFCLSDRNKCCTRAKPCGDHMVGIWGRAKWHFYLIIHDIEAEWRIYASVNYPSLVQIMARHLDGAKPLSEPILEYR